MDSTAPSTADDAGRSRETRWLEQFRQGLNQLRSDPAEAARIDALIHDVEATPAASIPMLVEDYAVSAGTRADGAVQLSRTPPSATPSFQAPRESDHGPARRRGRGRQPIGDAVGIAHRAWLEPIRHHLATSGLTLDDLASRTSYSKTRLSELLRGKGTHPRWETAASVAHALGAPMPPLLRLWTNSAREAGKKQSWIDKCVQDTAVVEDSEPLALLALTTQMAEPYTKYASAFLLNSRQTQVVVTEVFDILWMSWETALASANVRRYVWNLLRARVLLRVPQKREGRIDMSPMAMHTQAAHDIEDLAAQWAHVQELINLFEAISRLPDDHLDFIVLRYLCGMAEDQISDAMGVTSTLARVLDIESRQILEADLAPHPVPGRNRLEIQIK
jgi:transcriptional regulator with XRE-family HTH domain